MTNISGSNHRLRQHYADILETKSAKNNPLSTTLEPFLSRFATICTCKINSINDK